MANKHLFCFGYGYSAQALARQLQFPVTGTSRTGEGGTLQWPGTDIQTQLKQASHLLISIPPNRDGDLVLAQNVLKGHEFDWVGYLSTTAVYGDHGGAWVDETTPTAPTTKRGQWRERAEQQWLETGHPVHIFRLAGIYGPGRGPFAKVRAGTARQIIKPGQVFSRIHVDDIAQVLAASIKQPNPGAIYNLCDDDPAPPQDVLAYAAELLNMPLPPEEDFTAAEMTPMARSFYAENKRVRNNRIKSELGVTLKYPDYKSGLKELLEGNKGKA